MSTARKSLIVVVVSLWAAGVVMANLSHGSPSWEPWERIIVNAATATTLVAVFWPRTEHPLDAYARGHTDGVEEERARQDRRPGTGGLRLVR